ncbi:ferredoxin-NADP reductase [Amycolatopsis sulphurea]|uniref:Ferredoxin-NADP reductase n=1 Tax=Amycolatopsis sulphurea TaxID=76022 RepID=A0A2A9F7P1_9PSEU|nr:PDR/VanB family oxidoreductase [Amycolatopsis sulphurea]PFG46445.1 ferredoxin-NADP reductase [Amycolatopsis sulphurea]
MTELGEAGQLTGMPRMEPIDLDVSALRRLTADVIELELVEPTGAALPDWLAGSHVDLELGNGMVRQYSLCGTPGDRETYRIAVLRERNGRGGSQYLHDSVTKGDRVRLVGIRNTFRLAESAARYVFLAGGIGITPILSMIHTLRRRDTDWILHYGGRSRELMPFVDELAGLGDRVALYPQDETGLLPLPAIVERAGTDSAALYACGPSAMLDRLRSLADTTGGVDLHLERFVGANSTTAATGFTVTLTRSGRSLHVPADASLLEVLEDHGIDILSSCRSGICGTCEVDVLAGKPDHQDSILSDAERAGGRVMFPCVSRAATPRLDLDL